MQQQSIQFEFPDNEQRGFLKVIKCQQQLQEKVFIMTRYKRYMDHEISYDVRQDEGADGKIDNRKLLVFFTCCDEEFQRPVLRFHRPKGQNIYNLLQESTFLHKHSQKLKQSLQRFEYKRGSIQKNEVQNDKIEEQKQQCEIRNEQQIKQVANQYSSHKQSEQKLQYKMINEYNKYNKVQQKDSNHKQENEQDKLFEFPNQQQFEKYKSIQSRQYITATLNSFMRSLQFKNRKVKYTSTIQTQEINQQGEIVDNLMVEFKCCTGIDNHRPFLHFVKCRNGLFKLEDYSLWHDHRNLQQKTIIRNQINEIKQILNKPVNQQSAHCSLLHPLVQRMTRHKNITKQQQNNLVNINSLHKMQYEKSVDSQQLIKQSNLINNNYQLSNDIGQQQQKQQIIKKKNNSFKGSRQLWGLLYRPTLYKNLTKDQLRKKLQNDTKIKRNEKQLSEQSQQQSEQQLQSSSESNIDEKDQSINKRQNQYSSKNKQLQNKNKNSNKNFIKHKISNRIYQLIPKPKLSTQTTNSQQLFQFPDKQFLQRIKPQNSNTIRSIIRNHMIQNKEKDIKFHSKVHISRDKYGRKVYNFMFYFDCCQGYQKNKPYIHFISSNNNTFYLKGINQWHYHPKKDVKQKKNIQIDQKQKVSQQKSQSKYILKTKQTQKNIELANYNQRAQKISKIDPLVFQLTSEKYLQKLNKSSRRRIASSIWKLVNRKYKGKGIKYHQQSTYQEGDIIHFKIYFDCCKGFQKQKPIIHFIGKKNGQFVLVTSKNWHDHRPGAINLIKEMKQKSLDYQEQYQSLEDEFNQNSNENSQSQNEHHHNQQSNQYNEDNQVQEQQSQNEQSQQDKGNNQLTKRRGKGKNRGTNKCKGKTKSIAKNKFRGKGNTKQRQEKLKPSKYVSSQKGINFEAYQMSRKSPKVFTFPQKKQLFRFKQKNQASLRTVISVLARKYKNKGIKYSAQKKQIKNKNGTSNDHIFVRFQCCNGFRNQKPILHFIRKNSNMKYYLVAMNKWHDHRKKSDKNKQLKQKITKNVNQRVKQKQKIDQKSQRGKKQIQKKKQNLPSKTKHITKIIVQKNHKKVIHPNILLTFLKKVPNNKNSIKQNQKICQKNQSHQEHQQQDSQQNKQLNLLNSIERQDQSFRNKQLLMRNKSEQKNVHSKSYLNKKMTQQNSQLKQKQKQQTKNRSHIYCLFQQYSQQVSSMMLQRLFTNQSTDNDFGNQLKNKSNKLFSLLSKDSLNNQSLWKDCVFEMSQYNHIDILEIDNKKDQNNFYYQKLLFLKNAQSFKKNKYQNTQIYLAIYPITISSSSQSLKVFIAYTLTSSFQPQLLWFNISKENHTQKNFHNFLEEEDQQNDFYDKVFKEAIKHFNFKKVNFILTTLDYQLMLALDRICQTKTPSCSQQNNLNSTIHFSCIDSLFKTEIFNQNSDLGNEIRTRIRTSPNFLDIKISWNKLKDILLKNSEKDRDLVNPRQVYNYYRTFALPFSNLNINNQFSISMAFFSSELLYDEKDQAKIKDYVSQINAIFSQCQQLNVIAQVFVLIIKAFEPPIRKVSSKISQPSKIIPLEFYQIQKEIQIFNSINRQHQKLKYTIENIFAQPSYKLLLIVNQCPRFITQTIYRLIIAANKLAIKNTCQSYCQKPNSKFYLFQDPTESKKTFKVQSLPIQNQGQLKQFFFNIFCSCRLRKYHSFLTYNQKKWSCICNFYKQTGVPCEHQILAALQNKDSLFKEINQCWKQNKH